MFLIAWNHSNDEVVSKDIVHEVFMSLWERRDIVDIKDLKSFLTTAARFSIFKHYQREKHRSELFNKNYEYNELANDESKLDALFLQEYIDGIVEEMPKKCRLVFRYSREMGMKNTEIADKINITEKGVEATLTRALKIIRIELKNYGLIIFAILHIINKLLH
ncbi:MAG: polymerase sigma factor [Mucilaginibacter sp.]|nr:polymerase sigma factor [Mucilaginibacter sp.]